MRPAGTPLSASCLIKSWDFNFENMRRWHDLSHLEKHTIGRLNHSRWLTFLHLPIHAQKLLDHFDLLLPPLAMVVGDVVFLKKLLEA